MHPLLYFWYWNETLWSERLILWCYSSHNWSITQLYHQSMYLRLHWWQNALRASSATLKQYNEMLWGVEECMWWKQNVKGTFACHVWTCRALGFFSLYKSLPSCLLFGLKSVQVTASLCPLKCLSRIGSSCKENVDIQASPELKLRPEQLLN